MMITLSGFNSDMKDLQIFVMCDLITHVTAQCSAFEPACISLGDGAMFHLFGTNLRQMHLLLFTLEAVWFKDQICQVQFLKLKLMLSMLVTCKL